VIYMGVIPGTQECKKFSILEVLGCSQAQFLHALAKAKDELLLLSFTCSVYIACTLANKADFVLIMAVLITHGAISVLHTFS